MKSKTFEAVFLLIVFTVMLWTGYSILSDHRIAHEFPYGYLASDAFQDQTRAEGIKDIGNYRYEPFYIVAGFKDVVGYYPSILHHLSVIFSKISGLEVYDGIYFLVFFVAILATFVMYILIRNFNLNVAILSLPLCIFIFSHKTYNGFTWGRWAFMIGSLFLLASVWALSRLELKKSYIFLGIFISGILLGHQSEFMFFALFILMFSILKFFLYKPLDVKKMIFSLIVFLFLSTYFFMIFKGSFMETVPYEFYVQLDWGNTPLLYLNDFGILLVPIMGGVAVSLLYLKKKFNASIYLGFFMLLIGYMNYAGFGERSFQTRFFWPIYLSVFFGLGLFYLTKFIFKKKVLLMLISIIFLILFNANLFSLKLSKFSTPGLMNKYHWEALKWISENTPVEAAVYFFYGDIYYQDALLRNAKREHYLINRKDFTNSLQNQTIKRFYRARAASDSGAGFPYRKGIFSYGRHADNWTRTKERDICNYDYYVLDRVSQQPVLAQYNMLIGQKLLEKEHITEVFRNEVTSILKNNQPGADCIEIQKFS